jgi:hypothetical protein
MGRAPVNRRSIAVVTASCVLFAVRAAAQCDPTPVPPDKVRVTGVVLKASGGPRNGVAVRFTPPSGSANVARVTIVQGDGTYCIDLDPALETTTYVADIVGDSDPPLGATITLVAGQAGQLQSGVHLVSGRGRPWTGGLVALTILVYLIGLLLFRHHNIARTNRELLRAQLENIRTRIPLETDPKWSARCEPIELRLEEIETSFEAELTWKEWFFWSRGREIAAWSKIHEVERQLVAFLVPAPRVLERAVTAEADLRQLASPAATVLADRIRATLQLIVDATGNGKTAAPEAILEHLKQQLAEALTILYNNNDTRFSGLMEWTNKSMWLVYLSLIVIAMVSAVFRHSELFLLGAAGGLMSRMARSLHREDVPNDYGASWTTLFLSPLLGAISAWFGITLMMWLYQMGVLGAAFARIDWNNGIDAVLIAMAFTLGFSERLFTSLLSSAEGRVDSELSKAPSPTPAAAPGGVRPGLQPMADRTAAGEAPVEPSVTREDRIVVELDLHGNERVGFAGQATSATRAEIVRVTGAGNVIDVDAETLGAKGPFDAVLFETPLTIETLTLASGQIAEALQPDGRVVAVGQTSAALFEVDALLQREKGEAGPALVKDVFISAGLAALEPPNVLGGTDVVEWLASFVKPAAGGGDR